jgi:hypothetical protein
MANLQYPTSQDANEIPFWLNFFVAEYSLINTDRTRSSIVGRSFNSITLPLPKEPGYSVVHNFGEGQNPVGPVISMAGMANSGGPSNFGTLFSRVMAPVTYFAERQYATTTYRRFSNITELTMVSEARKNYYFEYIFVPKNEQEANAVTDIIGTFRKCSYPSVADGLPERSYPQNLWALAVGSNVGGDANILSQNWLGEPLPCVLSAMSVKHADINDPVVRYLPNYTSAAIMVGLNFTEFETGTYVPDANEVWSKSEISANYFGNG